MKNELLPITAIILTYNEEIHIQRCIDSISNLVERIIVVDSNSTDRTAAIAENIGAKVYFRKFVNQADQLQWALDELEFGTEWILRLDADEYLTEDLKRELREGLPGISSNITGVKFRRRVIFLNQWIRFGGIYPVILLRLWRKDCANVEQREMDEHMVLTSGVSIQLKHDFIDHNLNGIDSWIDKHNKYSSRELSVILKNAELTNEKPINIDEKVIRKRNMYEKMPLFFRCFAYFIFRYFLMLGFLDGKPGLAWHFLQGFWYRFLVDTKLYEKNIQIHAGKK